MKKGAAGKCAPWIAVVWDMWLCVGVWWVKKRIFSVL
jgi:hypothetical protein